MIYFHCFFVCSKGQYIVSGSDDGSFFIWEKETTNLVRILQGDESIVNCLQPHPSYCFLATSGIDTVVRLWSPRPEVNHIVIWFLDNFSFMYLFNSVYGQFDHQSDQILFSYISFKSFKQNTNKQRTNEHSSACSKETKVKKKNVHSLSNTELSFGGIKTGQVFQEGKLHDN